MQIEKDEQQITEIYQSKHIQNQITQLILDMFLSNDTICLIGLPGSGKTRQIIDILHTNTFEIITFSFSNEQVNNIINRMEKNLFHRQNISTLHKFSMRISQYNQMQTSIFNLVKLIEKNDQDIVKKIKLMNIQLVIVDEAQDLSIIQQQFLLQLQTISKCKLLLVGDPNQQIYQFQGGNTELLMNKQYKQIFFKENYRNPQNHVSFMNLIVPYQIYQQVSANNEDQEKVLECIIQEQEIQINQQQIHKQCNNFHIRKYTDVQDAIQKIIWHIINLKQQYMCKNSDIAIIGYQKLNKYERFTVDSMLINQGNNNKNKTHVESQVLGINYIQYQVKNRLNIGGNFFYNIEKEQDNRYKKQCHSADKINYLTVHSSKGLEFPHVIFVSCNQSVISDSYNLKEWEVNQKCTNYVAVSRQKKTLLVLSQLLPQYIRDICYQNRQIFFTYCSNDQLVEDICEQINQESGMKQQNDYIKNMIRFCIQQGQIFSQEKNNAIGYVDYPLINQRKIINVTYEISNKILGCSDLLNKIDKYKNRKNRYNQIEIIYKFTQSVNIQFVKCQRFQISNIQCTNQIQTVEILPILQGKIAETLFYLYYSNSAKKEGFNKQFIIHINNLSIFQVQNQLISIFYKLYGITENKIHITQINDFLDQIQKQKARKNSAGYNADQDIQKDYTIYESTVLKIQEKIQLSGMGSVTLYYKGNDTQKLEQSYEKIKQDIDSNILAYMQQLNYRKFIELHVSMHFLQIQNDSANISPIIKYFDQWVKQLQQFTDFIANDLQIVDIQQQNCQQIGNHVIYGEPDCVIQEKGKNYFMELKFSQNIHEVRYYLQCYMYNIINEKIKSKYIINLKDFAVYDILIEDQSGQQFIKDIFCNDIEEEKEEEKD